MNLGATIQRLRKQHGIKQKELAEMTGLTASYLSLIETNDKEPSLQTLKTIAETLDVPLPVLMFLTLDDTDAPKDKKAVFKQVLPSVLAMVETFFLK